MVAVAVSLIKRSTSGSGDDVIDLDNSLSKSNADEQWAFIFQCNFKQKLKPTCLTCNE